MSYQERLAVFRDLCCDHGMEDNDFLTWLGEQGFLVEIINGDK